MSKVTFILIVLALCTICTLAQTSNEIKALKDIYNQMGGSNWYSTVKRSFYGISYQTAWPVSCSTCRPCSDKWYGVICDSNNHIEALLLAHNTLTGTIPSSISGLSYMKQLYLFGNSISGSIPSSLGSMSRLTHIYLHENDITNANGLQGSKAEKIFIDKNSIGGSISSVLSSLSNIEEFDASDNLITGTLPSTLPSSLISLKLGNNKLTGNFQSHFVTHPNLIFVELQNNDLSGALPIISTSAVQSSSLQQLNLANNDFTCAVPEWVREAKFEIDISGMTFTCPVPLNFFNIEVDSTCQSITQTEDISVSSISVSTSGTPSVSSLQLTGSGLGSCSSNWQCLFIKVGSTFTLIGDGTVISDTSLGCSIPNYPTSEDGGTFRVCIGQNGEINNGNSPCAYLNVEKECPICNNGGICNVLTGDCICTFDRTGPTCDLYRCGDCNEGPDNNNYCDETTGKCVCDASFVEPSCVPQKTCNPACVDGQGYCDPVNGVCVCEPGWTGTTCSEVVDCSPACVNGECVSAKCECDATWIGIACDIRDLDCTPNDCNNRGACIRSTGICSCNSPYYGDGCEYVECLGGCGTRGDCDINTGKCVCHEPEKWGGPKCSDFLGDLNEYCPNNCNAPTGGLCDLDAEPNPQCVCFPPYNISLANDCSLQNCPYDCANRGECDYTTGKCNCDFPYAEPYCFVANASCPECVNGYCDVYTGNCICIGSFSGENCNITSCPNDCSGNGICADGGVCECFPEYSISLDCSVKGYSCERDCSNNGVCNSTVGECVCFSGYAGDACNITICTENNCSYPNGTCTENNGTLSCVCEPGFRGYDCSLIECGECLNVKEANRSCNYLEGTCNCADGFTGPTCAALRCPNDCSGNGQCFGGVCVCEGRWQPPDCAYEEPDYPLIVLIVALVVLGVLGALAGIFALWRFLVVKQLQQQTMGNDDAHDMDDFSDDV